MKSVKSSDLIESILSRHAFAVVGASRSREKFGYQVYRSLKNAGYTVFAVNPNTDTIDGDKSYISLPAIAGPIDCVVTVVPPEITIDSVREAGILQIPYLWMQPGSESALAVSEAQDLDIQVVHGGPCIMVEIAKRGHIN